MMVRAQLWVGVLLWVLAGIWAQAASAQIPPGGGFGGGGFVPISPAEEWEKRQGAEERLTIFGEDIMGDAIDPHTGSLVFSHTDVSLPGNSALPVALTRTRSQGFTYHYDIAVGFGDWDIEVPAIRVTSIPKWTGDRCSDTFAQNFPDHNTSPWPDGSINTAGSIIYRHQYSNGVSLEIPGMGSQTLYQNPGGDQWPSSATHATTENVYLYCGSASDGGEGFFAKTPNGNTYRFDRYISREATRYGLLGEEGDRPRRYVESLMATEVTDVHGNWVRYAYDGSGRLTRIHANDGREITLNYGGGQLVQSVTANGRTWTYTYGSHSYVNGAWQLNVDDPNISFTTLDSVTLPDGRSWSFDLGALSQQPSPTDSCPTLLPFVATVTHPSGLVGTFTLQEFYHRYLFDQQLRRANDCIPVPAPPGTPLPLEDATTTPVISVTEKRLEGSGVPTSVWTYEYEQDHGPSGSSGSDRTNWTKVTGPGVHLTYFHTWQTEPGGGQLVRRETRATSGGSVLESLDNTIIQEGGIGGQFGTGSGPYSMAALPNRTTQSVLTRDGETYTVNWTYNTNDSSSNYSFGSPLTETATSSLGSGTRTSTYTYEHKSSPWMPGLLTNANYNGKDLVQLTYNAQGNVTSYARVGTTKATLTYHGSGASKGLLHTYKDALDRTTTVNAYHRGVPTSLTRADGEPVSRTVDNNGWVTSQTDAMSVTTSFTHNTMGWLTGVDRVSPWSDTSITYSNLGSGVTQVSTRGNLRTTTSYDRYHRPTQVKSEDLSGLASTTYVRTEYDGLGRTIFETLPTFAASGGVGTSTVYDALGRPLTVTMTADNTTTTYAYLSDNRVSVTDPENNTTTTTSSGFGSPEDGNPILIAQPEGVSTTMTYDIWGNLTAATQGGFTQNWFYDGELRMCRHHGPETNSTLYKHNNADEMIWSAEGITGVSGCGNTSGSNRTYYTYDLLGRTTNINYPSGTPDIAMTYDDNGNLLTNQRGGANWAYAYNTANLVTDETLTIDGRTYAIDYAYNGDGALTEMTSPNNRVISYLPDGFGRPTRARINGFNYAHSAAYHASGALEDLTYGNGILRAGSFNNRHEMTRLHLTKSGNDRVDLNYGYDDNGRVTSITDAVIAGQDRSFTYDDLGRLDTAIGPWGFGSYAYDTANNLTSKTLGLHTVTLDYDANNRLDRYIDSRENAAQWQQVFYDSRGNVIDSGTQALGAEDFTYDHANQPVTMTGQLYLDTSQTGGALAQGADGFTRGRTGAPHSGPPPSAHWSFANGEASLDDLTQPGWEKIYTRDVIPSEAGRTYRLRVDVRLNAPLTVSGGPPFAIRFYKLTDTYGDLGGSPNQVAWQGCYQAVDGNWYTCETTYTSDGSETYLRPQVYRRTAVSGAGSLDLRNLIIDDITDGEPTQSGTATNSYDGHLRRVKQTSPRGTFYSIYNLAGQLIYQDNITKNERTDYISVGAQPVVRMIDGVRTAYVHTNHLGSTIAESDTNGDIVWREDYTPFGEARQNPAMNSNHTGFTGHAVDAASGLTYMQARYYDPAIGRFLSKDPVGFAEGGVGYFNRYSYVMNDPVNAVDPDGRFAAAVARIGIRLAAPRIVARLATAEGAQATANLAGVTTLLAGAGDPVETIKGLAQIADGIVASDNQNESLGAYLPIPGETFDEFTKRLRKDCKAICIDQVVDEYEDGKLDSLEEIEKRTHEMVDSIWDSIDIDEYFDENGDPIERDAERDNE